ncbi:MAG: aspartyl-tRNA(Asn)/glutamyl-tRNA (Gln) amidotransferase subunit B, partial [Parcubacteria group bacterium Gr01-1014_33]
MFQTGEDPSDIINQKGLWQMSDASDLEDICRHIVKENPTAVQDYKNGKVASLQFLTGQVMKESRGKANPKVVQEVIKKLLS